MCGVVGYITVAGDKKDPAIIQSMMDSVKHRGPNAFGVWQDERATLGHRRLRVIDLSSTADQPMQDSGVVLSYNGEVYNFLALRKKLQDEGVNFFSGSDTEVVLKAYLAWGEDFVTALEGDFALALWDTRKKRLSLIRDRLGVKPLYYAFQNGVFVFASEIKAILAHPAISKRPNLEALPEYIAHSHIAGHQTMFAGVFDVEPGECVVFENSKISKNFYYQIAYLPEVRNQKNETQIEGFESLFQSVLKERLISDVPLGLYLSGGIDSSYVATKLTEGGLDGFNSFSLGFKDYPDEFEYAQKIAQQTRCTHKQFVVTDDEIAVSLDKILWHHDEPPPFMVAVPQYFLAREAKRSLTVALSGTGGDELFCGYEHYLWANLLATKATAAGTSASRASGEQQDYLSRLAPSRVASEFKSCLQKYAVDKIIRDADDSYLKKYDAYFLKNDFPDFLSRMQLMDIKSYLVAVLNKDDKMNMAWGVEGRPPFLDHRLVEYALSMSPEIKINQNTTKWGLKKILAGIYGDDFAYRKKQAFPTPTERFLRHHQKNWCENLSPGLFKDSSMFDFDAVVNYAKDPALFCKNGVQARRQWNIFCLDQWYKKWFEE